MTLKRRLLVALAALFIVVADTVVAGEEEQWEQVVDQVASAVLSIRVDATRAFDTEWNSSTQATGFIVDAEKGIVLTNRHVVQPGPVIATGGFLNREEVELRPIYRDPVHDFGFYQYDPKALSFNAPTQLTLKPGMVQIGKEIRVIGNDGGEQLSILVGTIARLDREAPRYGRGGYNDFNTYYIQAASGISGGSSGSPVVDINGNVIALGAGASRKNAASFFLPLDRVARALKYVREGQPVPRGTLQTTFLHQPFDELRRLGLSYESEAVARKGFPQGVGLLIVSQVIPGSPAEGVLQPGDVLLRVEGEMIFSFVQLDKIWDSHVGADITLQLERGGQPLQVTLPVQDLHAITPDTYIEFGDAVVHNLSYQQARNYNVAVRGVYVAIPGYVLGNEAITRGTVITTLNNKPTPTLDAFEAVLGTLADGDKVAVRYFGLSDPRREVESVITMDRDWFGVRRCTRDPRSGFWPCHDLAPGPPPTPQQPGTTSFAETDDPRGKSIMPSLVLVDFDMPYQIDGVRGTHYVGTGLVVDAQRGLVVVDRNTVPASIGDVSLIFAGSLEVPGKVVMIHPYHNLSLVSYDPTLIGDTPVRSATFTTATLAPGDPIWLAGLKRNHQLAVQETTVASVDALSVPVPSVPWFRDVNIKLVSITNQLATIGGVLLDEEGRVAALWADFAFQNGKKIASVLRGIPADLVTEFAAVVKRGGPLSMRSLEAELYLTSLVDARRRGLPEQWLTKLAAHSPKRREVLSVTRLVAGTPASRLLREGDLLLAAGGAPISDFREVEKAAQAAVMKLTILRSGEVMEVDVPTVELSGRGTDRIVGWAGALMQRPPRALAAQRGFLDEGIYVAWTWWGSPANHFGLAGTLRIVEVDGVAVPDLDSFLAVVSGKADRESVRLKVIDLGGRDRVLTLKLDLHYWPMFELRRSADGWQRRDDFVPPMVH